MKNKFFIIYSVVITLGLVFFIAKSVYCKSCYSSCKTDKVSVKKSSCESGKKSACCKSKKAITKAVIKSKELKTELSK